MSSCLNPFKDHILNMSIFLVYLHYQYISLEGMGSKCTSPKLITLNNPWLSNKICYAICIIFEIHNTKICQICQDHFIISKYIWESGLSQRSLWMFKLAKFTLCNAIRFCSGAHPVCWEIMWNWCPFYEYINYIVSCLQNCMHNTYRFF